jgi:DNA (cytosine-5)-methyltransferase 1
VALPVALRGRDDGGQIECGGDDEPAFAVRTPAGGGSYPITAVAIPVDLRNAARETLAGDTAGTGIGQDGDPSFTLSATGRALPGVAMGFAENQRGEVVESAVSHQLTTGGGKPGQGFLAVRQEALVRRLTPLECERLQGFPDGWTDGQSDATRYRQLGNSVAVPCVEWITRRIAAVEASLAAAEEVA